MVFFNKNSLTIAFPVFQSDNANQELTIFGKNLCPVKQGMIQTVKLPTFYGDPLLPFLGEFLVF